MTKQKPSFQNGNLQFNQKSRLIQYQASNPQMTLLELAKWAKEEFKLAKLPSKSTISRTLKHRDQYRALAPQDHKIKRKRVVIYPIIENALATWVLQMQH